MKIIEIAPLENGAHRNQSGTNVLPEGWAVIPDGMETPNFPFGTITTAEVDGVMTVTEWVAGVMPDPEPEPEPAMIPTEQDDTNAMLVDHEYRLTLIELGLTEE